MKKPKDADFLHFPAPTVVSLPAKRKEPVTRITPAQHTQAEYERKSKIFRAKKDAAIAQGFEKFCIVSPRYHSSLTPALDGNNWGIVIGHPVFHMEEEKFKPITVRWLSTGKPDSFHNPNELFLIMSAVPEDDLRLFLEVQQEEMERKKC